MIIHIFNQIIIYIFNELYIQRNDYSYIQPNNYLYIQRINVFTSAISMATTLGRVVTFGRGTLPSKSHELLITWSHDK